MKTIIQLVQEVLGTHTKDYSVLSKLNMDDMKQKSFVFSYDDQESRIEYVLDVADHMTVVFEFECFLDLSESFMNVDNDYQEIEDLTFEQYHKHYADTVITTLEYYFDDGINELKMAYDNDKSDLSFNTWIEETFPEMSQMIRKLDLVLHREYEWIKYPVSFEKTLEPINVLESVKTAIKDNFINANKVIIVDGKEYDKNSDTWYIEEDGSLEHLNISHDYTPVEIVTSHIKIKDYIRVIDDFRRVMNKTFDVSTNESTGFHMNITLKKPIDFIKLIIMTRDNVSLERFKRLNTRASKWCTSQYNRIKSSIKTIFLDEEYYNDEELINLSSTPCSWKELNKFFPENENKKEYGIIKKHISEEYPLETNITFVFNTIKDVCEFIDLKLSSEFEWINEIRYTIIRKSNITDLSNINVKELDDLTIENVILLIIKNIFIGNREEFMDKYSSINFLKYKSGQMIEFRIMGDDYLGTHFDEVKKTAKWFIFMMAVASEPELYKEDYYQLIREIFLDIKL